MNIGQRIAHLRKRKGIQQCFLAKQLHRTPQWLSNIERGERQIGTQELAQVAKLLGVEPGIFFVDQLDEALSDADPQSA
jgi:transcriptional regulator with XRE-family HTH domain